MSELAACRNSLLVLAGIAALGGVAWSVVASPPELTVLQGGELVLAERHAAAQFSVIMVFSAIGVLISGAWGVYSAWRFATWGPWMIGLALLGAAIAAVCCWGVGEQLGPKDPRSLTQLTGGETVQDKLHVDSILPFLVWPWSAVLAAGVLTLVARRRDHSTESGITARDDEHP